MSNTRRVIFVSAVSNEFHNALDGKRHLFHSYRDVLKQAFRAIAPNYEVIIQEDLVVGVDDLLGTLDNEVARSLIVIHLVGDSAGAIPVPACVRNLLARSPNLLANSTELRQSIPNDYSVSYTQWEV